jgi:hypothetical protein
MKKQRETKNPRKHETKKRTTDFWLLEFQSESASPHRRLLIQPTTHKHRNQDDRERRTKTERET